jgi:hypothetical protein
MGRRDSKKHTVTLLRGEVFYKAEVGAKTATRFEFGKPVEVSAETAEVFGNLVDVMRFKAGNQIQELKNPRFSVDATEEAPAKKESGGDLSLSDLKS